MPHSHGALRAVLLDVGGTLWPERWTGVEDREAYFTARLCKAFPTLSAQEAAALVREIGSNLPPLDVPELEHDTDAVAQACAQRLGISLSRGQAARARRALCVPVFGRIELFPGALEMLAAIKARNLRAVVISNGVTRDAIAYMEDFEAFGVARYIDAVISSVDVGFRKPHLAVFEAALRAAQCEAEHCLMVGNSEANDVEPAKALGMRTVRVCIEEPPPARTAADAVVTSLHDVAAILDAWCR